MCNTRAFVLFARVKLRRISRASDSFLSITYSCVKNCYEETTTGRSNPRDVLMTSRGARTKPLHDSQKCLMKYPRVSLISFIARDFFSSQRKIILERRWPHRKKKKKRERASDIFQFFFHHWLCVKQEKKTLSAKRKTFSSYTRQFFQIYLHKEQV